MFKDLMQKLTDRRDGLEASAEEGFTLIELMVVLLIMGILLAIAIPTFLGVTGSSNDRASQSNLNTMLTSGKSIYEQQGQVYPVYATTSGSKGSLAAKVLADEPSLPIVTPASSGAGVATAGKLSAVTSAAGNGAVYYGLATKTGMCWWIADNSATIANPVLPWIGSTSGTATTTTGVPTTVGTYYGVFKPASGSCDAAGIGGVTYTTTATTVSGSTGNISSTSFPASS